MNVLVWLLTMLFTNRNPNILDGGDDTLAVGIFLLMLSPCGRALSVDSWLRRRRQGSTEPATTPAWPLRLIQIELCLIYTHHRPRQAPGAGPRSREPGGTAPRSTTSSTT